MAGWWDSIFGSSTPPPAHPASRGATFGAAYQNMPDMKAGIEDRRTGGNFPSAAVKQPLGLNAQILQNYPVGSHAYNVDQWQWLQKNMPDELPTMPLPDPGFSLDPSIMARAKIQPHPSWGQADPSWTPPGTTINSVPQGWQ